MDRSVRRAKWIASAVAAVGAVTALVAGLQPASAAPVARVSHPVVVTCSGTAQERPSRYVLACADYGDYVAGVQWVSWKNVAFGAGTEHIHGCYPSCAASNVWYTYPVLLTLWRPEARPGHTGERYFTRLTEIRTGSLKLPHYKNLPRTYTWPLAAWSSTSS
jgi:hypothetical protein